MEAGLEEEKHEKDNKMSEIASTYTRNTLFNQCLVDPLTANFAPYLKNCNQCFCGPLTANFASYLKNYWKIRNK